MEKKSMIRYHILIMGALLIAACETKDSIGSVEKSNCPPHNCPKNLNPGLTPIEKPNLEEEYYEAPRTS